MSDDEFLEAFERCTLVKSDWTHAAHVRMAWLYMSRNDFDEALRCIRQGIRRLNGHFGTASEKYHDTMTIAYSALIRERIERDPSVADWPGFTARYPETLAWSEPLPLRARGMLPQRLSGQVSELHHRCRFSCVSGGPNRPALTFAYVRCLCIE